MTNARLLPLIAALLFAACSPSPQSETGDAIVIARGETEPVISDEDAADDPAIWHNASEPAQSLIIGTDKQAGLYLYGLDGAVRGFTEAGRVNNVDIRDNLTMSGENVIVVAASDRNDEVNGAVALFLLQPDQDEIAPLARRPAHVAEAYGICLYHRPSDGALFAFVNDTAGSISQIRIYLSSIMVVTEVVRRLSVPTQPEGCVVDDRTGTLYVGEENAAIWRFDADPDASTAGTIIVSVDGDTLVADVEGLALAPEGERGGYLIASSQGDNAYALYDLETAAFVGRFRIGASENGIGATEETDGIELMLGDFGPDYPGGLFIAQDGQNAPARQNFKMVAWDDIRAALELP